MLQSLHAESTTVQNHTSPQKTVTTAVKAAMATTHNEGAAVITKSLTAFATTLLKAAITNVSAGTTAEGHILFDRGAQCSFIYHTRADKSTTTSANPS